MGAAKLGYDELVQLAARMHSCALRAEADGLPGTAAAFSALARSLIEEARLREPAATPGSPLPMTDDTSDGRQV